MSELTTIPKYPCKRLSNLSNEIGICLNKLGLQNISSDSLQVKKLRQELRERAFQSWCSLNQKGKGVILYKEFTPANKWIRQPDRLTSSEWRQALKMTVNVCSLRAIPGRSRDGNHCRRCVSEIETLGHVLGACPFSETLRNSRHHRIRSMIAEVLRKKGLTVHEEVHGISQEGSCRRIDMLAIPPGYISAYIIEPTVSQIPGICLLSPTFAGQSLKQERQIYSVRCIINSDLSSVIVLKDGRVYHLHEANGADVEVKKVSARIKTRDQEPPHEGPSRIIRDVNGENINEEVLEKLPDRTNLRRAINKEQNRNRPQNINTLQDL
ncbi:hypothetical protein ANN_22589 [Periplaneta americana]|uniref:Reverse transcriptase n=1 Tax=Periplaneta americana TaxID=6978 RepID=A0ABQ8S8W1_PERAM|nr:hypothetical protein ANN_22589 [Periplaneta americana]